VPLLPQFNSTTQTAQGTWLTVSKSCNRMIAFDVPCRMQLRGLEKQALSITRYSQHAGLPRMLLYDPLSPGKLRRSASED
jgi:hypothetical protein